MIPSSLRRAFRAACLATLVAAPALAASAAPAEDDDLGTPLLWLEAGLGLSSLAFGGDAGHAGADRETGLAAGLGAGLRLNRSLALGYQVDQWTKESAGLSTTLRSRQLVLVARPAAWPRYRFKVGAGRVLLDEPEIGNRAEGPAASLEVARQLRQRRHWRLGLRFQALVSREVEVEQRGRPTGFTEDPSLITVGLVASRW